MGRSLRGNVDRNKQPANCHYKMGVVPYVGTWIEMSFRRAYEMNFQCRSLRGNVDRNKCGITEAEFWEGRSLRGNVDRNLYVKGSEK